MCSGSDILVTLWVTEIPAVLNCLDILFLPFDRPGSIVLLCNLINTLVKVKGGVEFIALWFPTEVTVCNAPVCVHITVCGKTNQVMLVDVCGHDLIKH